MSQVEPTKKLSRSARYNKKRRLNKEKKSAPIGSSSSTLPANQEEHTPTIPLSRSTIPPEIRLDIPCIIFDPNRHRSQSGTRGLSTEDKIFYIEKEWKCVPLTPSDCVATKGVKSRERISAEELLIETLIRESRFINNIEQSEIPPNFLALIDDEIIKGNHISKVKYRTENLNEDLWLALGQWLGMEEPLTRREVRQHLRRKWKKISHAIELRNNIGSQDESGAPGSIHFLSKTTERISRKTKAQLIISTRENFRSLKELVRFRYIFESECVTDINGRSLIHLEKLNNQNAVTKATDAVNHYYFHTLEHPSHRSDEFWRNFIEHFGVYSRNNLLPYTSTNTASVHNVEHQECVDTLLRGLGPLSISVNEFVQEYYGELYGKLEKLSWGVFGPKPFGVFPMIAINYNTISDYHWDEHDEPNSLCCLVALGEFEGGELCFPQLQIIVPLRPGQVVAFSSRLLLHGNFPVTKGIRHSVVYFVHSMFFHHLRDFTDIYKDRKEGIERNASGLVVPMIPQQNLNDANGLNRQVRLDKPKKSQTEMPEKSCDKRRGNIDLTRARRGLRAEDPGL